MRTTHVRTPTKALIVLILGALIIFALRERKEPIRVGVIFSSTGSNEH